MPTNGHRLSLNWSPPAPKRPRTAPAGSGGGSGPREPEAWAARYIGLLFKEHGRDWEGADCWGLPHLALWEERGVRTAPFDTGYVGCRQDDAPAIAGLIAEGRAGWIAIAEAPYLSDELAGIPKPGRPAADYWLCPLGAERPFDVLLIRQYGVPCHIGLVAGGGYMLHTEEGVNAVCVPYGDRDWRRRIVGVYRHPQLVG